MLLPFARRLLPCVLLLSVSVPSRAESDRADSPQPGAPLAGSRAGCAGESPMNSIVFQDGVYIKIDIGPSTAACSRRSQALLARAADAER